VCLHLLPGDDIDPDEQDCPDGAIPLQVAAEPVLWACVIVLVDGDGGSGDSGDSLLGIPLP